MELTSVSFLIFILVSLFIYLVLPHRLQWIELLAVSLIFYALNISAYTFLYLLVGVMAAYIASNVGTGRGGGVGKLLTVLAVLVNIGMLAVLKYSNLALTTAEIIALRFGAVFTLPRVTWLAPLGMSFYTLQIVSYILDCYWGQVKPVKNPLKLLLYACYFPQMISGPISRYGEIGHQLFEEHRFSYERISNGLIRMIYGIFEKRVVSARLSIVVDTILSDHAAYQGVYVLIAALLFPLQLYSDFAGCMDIIMGASECFGIVLPENFRAPFFSRTTQEIWQRWHITLGGWLRDYIMNPILKSDMFVNMGSGLKKRIGKKWGKRIPVFLAMLILWLCMGLWHGSDYKYILGEGLWFWAVIVIGQILSPIAKDFYKKHGINEDTATFTVFRVIRTYLLFAGGMIFFRAADLNDASFMFKSIASVYDLGVLFDGSLAELGLTQIHIAILVAGIVAMYFTDRIIYRGGSARERLRSQNVAGRWLCYWGMILFIVLSLTLSVQEFIYFQF